MRRIYADLTDSLDAWYEVDVDVLGLDGDVPAGAHELTTTVRLTASGRTLSEVFGGELTDTTTLRVIDTRPVVFRE